MKTSQIKSQSFIKPKPKPVYAKVSRCPSSASMTTRCSSTTSNKVPKVDQKPIKITATNYCVYNMNNGFIICSKKDLELREIASLTKIMTAYTVLNLIEEKSLGTMNDVIKISKNAARVNGTTAGLTEGDEITARDLLYGLMLPSGNDAATALAEHFGKKLGIGNPLTNFVNEMNYNSKKLGLFYTSFGNPHGLTIKRNLSNARDVCKLAAAAMKNKNFQRIVSSKSYTACIESADHKTILKTWDNTNKMLNKSFSGIKTGITNKAGPCLCTSYGSTIVTLLNSRSMEDRWREAEMLMDVI
jgi:D-alanyl-D-alanine carboxypeptidase